MDLLWLKRTVMIHLMSYGLFSTKEIQIMLKSVIVYSDILRVVGTSNYFVFMEEIDPTL